MIVLVKSAIINTYHKNFQLIDNGLLLHPKSATTNALRIRDKCTLKT